MHYQIKNQIYFKNIVKYLNNTISKFFLILYSKNKAKIKIAQTFCKCLLTCYKKKCKRKKKNLKDTK